MSNTLNPGDVVQLKSGGPLMTASHMTNERKMWCLWFDGKEAKGHEFRLETLQAAGGRGAE